MNSPDTPINAMANDLATWLHDYYGVNGQHLWEQYPEYTVYRHETRTSDEGPWFLLICNVDYQQISIADRKGEVFIAVVKDDPAQINELITKPGFARGYHMNKKHWLTVLLDGTVPKSVVQQLISNSYRLTNPHH